MKFEEQFPSLKEHNLKFDNFLVEIYSLKLQKYCLDKQKVRDAIEKCRGWEDDRNLDDLKKELGL
jgi:hypothetical protein